MFRNRARAQSIVETLIGIIVLIPIVLFLFDIAALVLANSANDNLAKHCARAAASATTGTPAKGDGTAGKTAAEAIANRFAESPIIKKPGGGGGFLTGYDWNPGGVAGFTAVSGPAPSGGPAAAGQVVCETTMLVHMPVEFPFFKEANFRARAVEPIVSIPPP